MSLEYWKVRAEGYERLEWATRDEYLRVFVAAGHFQPGDRVLDVGTGSGIVAHAMAPLVSEVVGVDISPEMLELARASQAANESFVEGDARSLNFPDGCFDKVTARMAFHHLVEGGERAMRECHRVLRPGGLMVFSEAVPPDPSLGDWFARMFALKEERLVFFADDLVALMEAGGFAVERAISHATPQVSIQNWLRNSGLPQGTQDRIVKMHLVDLGDEGRRHYNMTVADDGDIRCDFSYVTLAGRK